MQWNIKIDTDVTLLPKGQYHPVVNALLESRGYISPDQQAAFLSPQYERDVHDPFLFLVMSSVVERVRKALEQNETVGIFGDFDADGVTSSVILRVGLEKLGLTPLVYLPDKLTEGHGLSVPAVEFFAREGATLIFTLDCGMMNHEEILLAKEKGIETIVVDHHHVPELLPAAYAIVNPNLLTETYPFRELCGAGTTFKVVQALIETFLPEELEQTKWLLDAVAIGTVADVMPLIGENRALVQYGLLVLQKTKRLGLRALLQEAQIDQEHSETFTAELIAFQIAPRINAASRMAHAKIAHDLLMTESDEEAVALAKELQKLNVARQKQSQKITDEVALVIEQQGPRFFAFAAEEHYPYGIVGLIAGRIASTYQRPTAIVTKGEHSSRGSFRSIPGFSVIAALEQCADLLEKYGGHAQAAGMHIQNSNLALFEERFEGLAEEWFLKQGKQASDDTVLTIDAELTPAYVNQELVESLKKMAPFGEGNREPVFLIRNLEVKSVRRLGAKNQHLKLVVVLFGTKTLDVIAFNHKEDEERVVREGSLVTVIGTLNENLWQGRVSLQLQAVQVEVC
jgi:single-stranded-DNA-specific exonuclease